MECPRIDKLYRENFDKRDNYKQVADYLVAKYTDTVDEKRKIDTSADTAVGMAIGAAIARNDNLVKGLAIGVVGTSLAFIIYGKIKKRRNTKEEGV